MAFQEVSGDFQGVWRRYPGHFWELKRITEDFGGVTEAFEKVPEVLMGFRSEFMGFRSHFRFNVS